MHYQDPAAKTSKSLRAAIKMRDGHSLRQHLYSRAAGGFSIPFSDISSFPSKVCLDVPNNVTANLGVTTGGGAPTGRTSKAFATAFISFLRDQTRGVAIGFINLLSSLDSLWISIHTFGWYGSAWSWQLDDPVLLPHDMWNPPCESWVLHQFVIDRTPLFEVDLSPSYLSVSHVVLPSFHLTHSFQPLVVLLQCLLPL
jgi:hypothetical protein